jgi:ribosomal protein S18 acetylase RimI-like enzyme
MPIQPPVLNIRAGLQPGDIGYIIYLHGLLYAKEYGFDTTFDGCVASGMGEFAQTYDPQKDCLWVAELDREIVGSIAIVGQPDGIARLRWFLVHPRARGCGFGRGLLECALGFCRKCGFSSVFLWTLDNLEVAIHLYRAAGFRPTEEETHFIWGHTLTKVRYDLRLQP